MDLRDLGKLSEIVTRAGERFALADLTWVRLRALQDMVARFFDEPLARGCLDRMEQISVRLAMRPADTDAASRCGRRIPTRRAPKGGFSSGGSRRLSAGARRSRGRVGPTAQTLSSPGRDAPT
jgi:hypothetical protein